jgi:hypothetical protein
MRDGKKMSLAKGRLINGRLGERRSIQMGMEI